MGIKFVDAFCIHNNLTTMDRNGRILSRMRPASQRLMAHFDGSNFWKPPPLWGSHLTECFRFVGLWPTLCFREYFILLSCYWALGPHVLKVHYCLCSFIYLSKG